MMPLTSRPSEVASARSLALSLDAPVPCRLVAATIPVTALSRYNTTLHTFTELNALLADE